MVRNYPQAKDLHPTCYVKIKDSVVRNAECGMRKAESGRRKAESGRQKAESGRQKAEGTKAITPWCLGGLVVDFQAHDSTHIPWGGGNHRPRN